MRSRPVVGLICDHRVIEDLSAQSVFDLYITAIRDGARALPLLIPALDPPLSCEDILASVDGLLFTGSISNVAPHFYGGPAARNPSLLDKRRDALAQPLIRAAVEAGVPLLSICRGTQELNVALGGTLHQHVQEVQGRLDHRERGATNEEQWGPSHTVTVSPEGLLARIVGPRSFAVNSLHSQGIDKLAPPLHADATAPDSQIEAVSMPDAQAFVLGLQWHPEWRREENDVSRAVFDAFAAALRRAQ
jgi:putative glutamine amidotransferase